MMNAFDQILGENGSLLSNSGYSQKIILVNIFNDQK